MSHWPVTPLTKYVGNVLINLQVLDPRQTALVTLGSVKNLLLEGGPLPWILDTSSYYEIGEVGYYSLIAYYNLIPCKLFFLVF